MKIKQVLITILFLAVSFLMVPVSVSAQVAGCVNPGPYGICPPSTDITVGGFTIDDQLLTFMILGLVAGSLLIVNGLYIRHNVALHRSPFSREA